MNTVKSTVKDRAALAAWNRAVRAYRLGQSRTDQLVPYEAALRVFLRAAGVIYGPAATAHGK
jgi:hypothetical protein